MKTPISNQRFIQRIRASQIFDNADDNSLPQTVVAEKVLEHMQQEGNKKVLLIAFDAVRADALFNIVAHGDKKKYPHSECSPGSGINYVRQTGGLYLSYTGGDPASKETWQECSTIPGFSTLLSGQWADKHKVKTNNDGFSFCAETVLLQCAKMGKKVSFNAAWDAFFTCLFAKDKALGLPNYTFHQSKTDCGTFQNMAAAIRNGDDVVFGIFENPDNNGHRKGFKNANHRYVKAVMDSDRYAYELIQLASQKKDADWLLLITTDHGGHAYRHGTRRETDRLTFLASNQKMI